MEKYLFITLVLLCVCLGAYAAGLQRRLRAAEAEKTALNRKLVNIKNTNNNAEYIDGILYGSREDMRAQINVLEQHLHIANVRLARVRNRLRSK